MNASEPREDAVAVLPPLPEVPHMYCPGCDGDIPMYDAGQMHAYAIAALAQQGAEPVAWKAERLRWRGYFEAINKDENHEYLNISCDALDEIDALIAGAPR